MAAIHRPLPRVATPRTRPAAPRSVPALGRPNWWVWCGIAIVGLSALVPVLQSSTVTSEGFSMQRSQADVSRLNAQISILESEIGEMTSLNRIEQRAQELGLQPATNPTFLHVDVAGPAPAKIPASYLPAPSTTQEAPASWWQSLFSWLPLPH